MQPDQLNSGGRNPPSDSSKGKSSKKKKRAAKLEDSPMDHAHFLSLMAYAWVSPLIKKGLTKQLQQEDMFPTLKRHTAQFLGNRLETSWRPALQAYREGRGPKPRLWRHVLWPFRFRFLFIGVLIIAESAQRIVSAFVVRQLVLFLQGHGDQSMVRGYSLAACLGVLGFAYAVVHHQLWNYGNVLGWNLRVAAMAAVNRKLLCLNSGSLAHTTVGHCINLLSTDVRRFDDLPTYSNFIWAGPMELTVVTVLIALELGVRPALAGVATLLALIPLQATFGHFFAKQRRTTVKFTDRRVKMTGEVLNGIVAIKMFAWEPAFTNIIESIRRQERKNIERSSYIKAFNEATFFSSSAVVSFITFATSHALGHHLAPSSVFYVLSLLQLPRLWMCIFFPVAIERVAEGSVSFNRLQLFLELPEPAGDHWENLSAWDGQSPAASKAPPSVAATEKLPSGESKQEQQILEPGPPTAELTSNGESKAKAELPSDSGQEIGLSQPVVSVTDGAFSWDPIPLPKELIPPKGPCLGLFPAKPRAPPGNQWNEGKPSLKGVTFQLGPSELLGVTGKVGSGKSTLLAALLGELHVVNGTLAVNAGRIAFAAQKPFIVAGTFQENVLFGRPYNKEKFDRVAESCALVQDIAQLPHGELTEIGERGINLSGGQKARVGLARAAYADSDLILLDDPLSAVDPAVGRHLFEKCITGMMQGKPRVLLTHQLQYLPRCDRVLLLRDGEMDDIASFEELQERGVDFHGFLDMAEDKTPPGGVAGAELDGSDDDVAPPPADELDSNLDGDVIASGAGVKIDGTHSTVESELSGSAATNGTAEGAAAGIGSTDKISSGRKSIAEQNDPGEEGMMLGQGHSIRLDAAAAGKGGAAAGKGGAAAEDVTAAQPGGLVQVEGRMEGTVDWHVYMEYARSMGFPAVLMLILLLSAGQAVICTGDWFLAFWSQKKDQSGAYVAVYAGIEALAVIISFLRAGLFFRWAVLAASRIHSAMLAAVLGSPLGFFHSNPAGRILNRFAADQGLLDDMLPITAFNYYQTVFITLGALALVAIGVPWIALAMLPLGVVFLHLRRVFLRTSRESKRLEAISRSPVYAHYAAAIQGLSTIRAFQAQAQFDRKFKEFLDANGRGFFVWMCASRWLAFRLDCICAVVVLLAGIISIAARDQLSTPLVGLALSYVLQLSGMFQWAVRQSAEVENMFTGVERAIEYTRLPQERHDGAVLNRPDPSWPSRGAIELQNVTVRYREGLAPVLVDLSVAIGGGEKCGIVGRTGAGKSTLMLTLFRLVDATSGRILIDGIDISSIGLEDLRRKVMAIPQDPVLFGNTLRFNLDPFELYDDAALWEALAAVQLKTKASGLSDLLGTSMAEFGENFSVGERQLVCLARAILQNNRILVMDEATANVDLETDSLIQQTLKDKFTDSTVLIIAHRMDTIIDADKIIVLEHGRLMEHGTPAELLDKDKVGGMFATMVKKTGQASEALLRQRAI